MNSQNSEVSNTETPKDKLNQTEIKFILISGPNINVCTVNQIKFLKDF